MRVRHHHQAVGWAAVVRRVLLLATEPLLLEVVRGGRRGHLEVLVLPAAMLSVHVCFPTGVERVLLAALCLRILRRGEADRPTRVRIHSLIILALIRISVFRTRPIFPRRLSLPVSATDGLFALLVVGVLRLGPAEREEAGFCV